MKTILITSVLVILCSFSNVYAGNPKNKIYSNIENNEFGCVKEYTTVDKITSTAISKDVYIYDTNGILLEKTNYTWTGDKGWKGFQKYEYEYNPDKTKLVTLIYTKWDKDIANWSPQSQHSIHVYDINGELLTIKHVQVNKDNKGLIADK